MADKRDSAPCASAPQGEPMQDNETRVRARWGQEARKESVLSLQEFEIS